MQRDPKLGTRNVLTEAEFVARRAQFERQAAQDEADFDLDTAPARRAATWAVRCPRRRTGWSAASRITRRRSSSIRPMAACRR